MPCPNVALSESQGHQGLEMTFKLGTEWRELFRFCFSFFLSFQTLMRVNTAEVLVHESVVDSTRRGI